MNRTRIKDIKIKVLPNHNNVESCCFVIYKKSWFPFYYYEFGRLSSFTQLQNFAKKYQLYNGESIEHVL